VVGDADPAKPGGAAVAALPLVQKAIAGTVGVATAPHLWMLIDPQCIYSVRAFQMLQPYVSSGRLQLSVIPLSVLDYEDKGQSTRSALALLSNPSEQIVSSWQAGKTEGPSAPAAADHLRVNMAISNAIPLQGTPTFVWRKSDGTEGRMDGLPTNVEALVASIGG
jgi:thiol:disulfide interchange protein DsbG